MTTMMSGTVDLTKSEFVVGEVSDKTRRRYIEKWRLTFHKSECTSYPRPCPIPTSWLSTCIVGGSAAVYLWLEPRVSFGKKGNKRKIESLTHSHSSCCTINGFFFSETFYYPKLLEGD